VAVELRTYLLIDDMQPQYAAFVGKTFIGSVAVEGMSQLYIEVAPASDIYEIADAALKAAEVRPGGLSVEREFGTLVVHSELQESVRAAGRAALNIMDLEESDRVKPEVVSSRMVTSIDPYMAQRINKNSYGGLLLKGQTLCVLEVTPAAYVVLAANEAEKAANITLVNFRDTGRFGRLYISGTESEVEIARSAAIQEIEALSGQSSSS